ncbi:membrane-associated protein, putative [Bodo saltans]|uniref:Membrane-associated protein, putative n=1 Tax=Bodo saltans TaxID=75058 RepID=A0A0S4J2J1_BODSA|nr:membrane-associated protein, putative [Bodo saltans]|eukprot:CUG44235.1 membrane-associated protein, putative [Bodo saltans]
MKRACIVAVAAAALVVAVSAQSAVPYNPAAAVAWLNQQGCQNASQNPTCPGGVPCYDDEFVARSLAAGGAIALDPNVVSNAAYTAYQYNGVTYDLTTQTGPPSGLYNYLIDIGWYNPQLPGCSATNESACFPAGAVIVSQNAWQQPVILSAVGNALCSCGSPLNTNGDHCGMPCHFFSGTDLFYPPPAAIYGPIVGSYTPNNQTFQDFTLWPNMFNTPETAVNLALNVLEVGWSANDAANVLFELNYRWNYDTAIPIITWMPYPYKTWANPSPNTDIVNGLYDDYIAQFLSMLSGFLGGTSKRVYLRFAPQPNGDWFPWNPYCGSCNTNGQHINQTAASYVKMWKYVIGKLNNASYSFPKNSIQLIFDVNNVDASSAYPVEVYFPGTTHVDWFMVTGYNWGNTLPGNVWLSPTQVFSPMVARLRTLSSTTPLGISGASTSLPNGVAAKNTWITEFFAYAVASQVKMILSHNADTSTDLSMFGGGSGTSTWRSPLSQITYNVYGAWSTALNDHTNGVQGINSTDARYLSDAQFMGNF